MASRIDSSQNRKLYVGTSPEVSVGDGNAIIDGNVGIGTTIPLSLSANTSSLTINSTRNDLTGALFFRANNTSKAQLYCDSVGLVNEIISGSARWFTGNTERMRIDSVGKVGIGTTLPSARLNIVNTSSTSIPALQVASSASLANNDIIRFQINGLTNGFRMFQNASSVVNYTFQDGNVGIGTTAPNEKLEVNGNLLTRGKTRGLATNYATSEGWVAAGAGAFTSRVGYFGGNFSAIGNGGSENKIEYAFGPFGAEELVWMTVPETGNNDDGGWNKSVDGFANTANNGFMSVIYMRRDSGTPAGNFYHGCSPTATNNLDGTANTNPYFCAFGISLLPADVWCVSIGIIYASGDASTTSSSLGGSYRLDTGEKIHSHPGFRQKPGNSTQQQRVYHYYSTSPSAQLDFTRPGWYVVDGTEPTLSEITGGAAGTDAFWSATGNDIHNDNSGNVGINNTSPQAKLQVETTAALNTAIFENSGQTYSYTAIKVNEALNNKACLTFVVGDALASTDVIGEISGLITSNGGALQGAITFKTNPGDNLSESMRILANGNVGIGTTLPTAPLDVFGVRAGRNWAINNRADIRLDSNGVGVPSDILWGHTAAANQLGWTGVYWAASSRGTSASNKFYFYRGGGNPTGASEAVIMSFDPNMRVGINQTTPTTTLDVSGTGNFTGLVSGITPVASNNFVTKAYADGLTPGAGVFLPLAGGTMATGAIITGTDTLIIRTDQQLLIRASDNSSIASFKYINTDYNVLEIFDDNRLRFQDGMELYLDESGIIDYMMFTTETSGAGNHAMHRFAGYEFQGTGLATIMKMGGAINATNIELYQNGTKRLETTTTGVTITGRLSGLTNPTDAQDAVTKDYVDGPSTSFNLRGDSGSTVAIFKGLMVDIAGGTNISTEMVTSGTTRTLTINSSATSNTGTVTSVATGGGLDGGTITTTGTLEVEYDGVSTNIIQSGFDFTGDTVVSGDLMMISDPGATSTYRRIGYVTVGDLTTGLINPVSGNWFRGVPTIGGDGLMEVGRYIDFHNTNTATNDFDVRLDCRTGNELRLTGTFKATGNVICENLGVGINPPREGIELFGASKNIAITNTEETDAGIIFRDSGGIASQAAAIKFNSSDQKLKFFVNDETAQRMVIDTNGYVGINTTSPNVPLDVEVSDGGSSFNDGAAQFSNITTNSSGGATVINVRNNYSGGNGTLLKFFRTSTSTSIGFISFNGSGNAVVYSTTSDYRLKEDLKSFNGLEIIDQIKTYNYKWKSDDSRGYGTLAHELQEVFPDAVTGNKDGEDMQGVDYSTLVPVLIKSVQELKKEIEELKQQLNK